MSEKKRWAIGFWSRHAVRVAVLALIAAVAIFGIYGPGYDAQQFIYFQF